MEHAFNVIQQRPKEVPMWHTVVSGAQVKRPSLTAEVAGGSSEVYVSYLLTVERQVTV